MSSGPSIKLPIKRPLIILCPPRSFSSVVCAMIGRHPELYAFPELNLFVTDRVETLLGLSENREFIGLGNYVSGIVRTIAETYFSGQGTAELACARAWLESRRESSTQAIMNDILVRIDPSGGVEKSTRTALSQISLERALGYYPQARFLHLTRHPATAVDSMRRCQTLLSPEGSAAWNDAGVREYCGKIWLHAHRSILRFTSALPSHQSLRVKAEEIVRDPDEHLSRLMSWLDLPCEPSDLGRMKHPETWPFACHARGLPYDCDSSFLADPHLREIPHDPPLELIGTWGLSRTLATGLIEIGARFGYA